MLIAQDQLEQVRRQVSQSDQPVVVADLTGRILLLNEAFERMLPRLASAPAIAAAICRRCSPIRADIRRRVRDLLDQRRAWRGEARLEAGDEAGRAVLVRADPVLAPRLTGCWASCCCSPI